MMSFFTTCLFSLSLLLTANIQMGSEPADYGEIFGNIVAKTGMRLQEAAARRPLKLKSMNDSLADLADASRLMASRGDSGEVLRLLESSRRHQSANSFSWLLEGVWLNAHGRNSEADAAWEKFLVSSRVYSELDKAFIHWDDFHKLRRIAYEMLRSRGVSFEGREKDIQVRVPFAALAKYIRDPAAEDRVMNIVFIAVLFGGLFLFAGVLLTGHSLQTPLFRQLTSLYGVFWFCYGVWFLDLFLELPFGWSRFQLVPGIAGGSLVFVLGQIFLAFMNRRRRIIEDGYKVCPFCRAVITRLHLECPECRRSFSGD